MHSKKDVKSDIIDIIGFSLGFESKEIDLRSSLKNDLMADSLDIVEIAIALEEKYQIDIHDETLEKIKTVGDFISVAEHLISFK